MKTRGQGRTRTRRERIRSDAKAAAARKAAKNDHDRLHDYAEGYFQRSGRTEWPTVRMAAKALRMTNDDVESAVDGDPDSRMQLTSHQVEFDFPLGEHFVEVVEGEDGE